MLLHVSNWISIWCSISLVYSELGWVDGGGCFGGGGYWVQKNSNIPITFFLSYGAMVLRLKPSIITFSSIFSLVPVLGILSISIGYGLQRIIEGLLLGFCLSHFLPSLPV